MPPVRTRATPTRAERRARTRDQLIAAAERRFKRDGFHATSVDAVADEAGYTKGAVYSNFASKEALFFAVYERHVERRAAVLEEVMGSGAPTREQVRAAVDTTARADDGWLAVFFEFWAHVLRHPEHRQRFAELHRRGLAPVVASMHALAREHSLPLSPELLATAQLALGNGLQLERLTRPEEIGQDDFEQAMWLFARGATARRRRHERGGNRMSRTGRILEFGRALRAAGAATERERWPAQRMRDHQERAFAALLHDVTARSPLYRERLRGVTVLADAPPIDKATLMAHLDDALTAPALRGRDLRALAGAPGLLDGEYRVMASSGSTGTPSLYVYDRADWTGILAQFRRYSVLAGIAPRLPRLRVAAIGAPSLASMTQRVAESSAVGVHRVLRLAVTDPLPRLAQRLDAFRPDVLAGYPSVVAALAGEQLAGRLRIAPRIVSTSSELRTPDMTERIRRAFGVDPFDLYGTSEGLWGAECEHHAGAHLFEDWCIVENVDAEGRPVPDGEPGARLLVTNLHNRTLPLIRFEVSDVVVLDRTPCACGRTLPRLQTVHGRLDDILELPGRDGRTVAVHPAQFSVVPEDPAVRGFQVRGRSDGVLVRLVLGDEAGDAARERIARAVTERLEAAGVRDPVVRTEQVDAIERNAAGKLRLVVPESSRSPTLA